MVFSHDPKMIRFISKSRNLPSGIVKLVIYNRERRNDKALRTWLRVQGIKRLKLLVTIENKKI